MKTFNFFFYLISMLNDYFQLEKIDDQQDLSTCFLYFIWGVFNLANSLDLLCFTHKKDKRIKICVLGHSYWKKISGQNEIWLLKQQTFNNNPVSEQISQLSKKPHMKSPGNGLKIRTLSLWNLIIWA